MLVWFSSRPKVLLPLLAAALLIGGLAAPTPVGVPLLILLLALVGWLTYLSWPVLGTAQQVLRAATIGLVLAAAAGRLSA